MSFIRLRVPPDNSCLFTAVDCLLHSGVFRENAAADMRALCIERIKGDHETYSDLYLGQRSADYCDWLSLSTSWGGEVEIIILAELNNIQISIVQMETLSILTYSPPFVAGQGNIPRIFLLYTGQHYDALMDEKNSTYTFADDDSEVVELLALSCAESYKKAWDDGLRTRNRKRIKCLGCQAILMNAQMFQEHCNSTEHADNFAYDCEDIEILEYVDNATDD